MPIGGHSIPSSWPSLNSASASTKRPCQAEPFAKVTASIGKVRLEPESLAELGDRLLQFPLGVQGEGELVMGFELNGIEPQCFAELGDRLLQFPLGAQGAAVVVMGIGVVGL